MIVRQLHTIQEFLEYLINNRKIVGKILKNS
jgi:hypothetical protein